MECATKTRFTSQQSDVLCIGLRPPILNYICLKQTGRSPAAHPDLLSVKFYRRQGTYSDPFMQSILRLWKGLQANRGKEIRLSLNYIETCALGLAVRTALRQIRHRDVLPWTAGIESTANHLLRRLEMLRKRLKRKITKTEGHAAFRNLSSNWRQFLTWMRLTLLTCPCLVRRPNPLYRSRQLLIDKLCDVTRAEMLKTKKRVPDEQVFRKLVRDGLRLVRRYRTPLNLLHLRLNPHIADWWFAEYVSRRMGR